MAKHLDTFIDIIAERHSEQTEGTGAASKILSALSFPVLTVLAVQLIKDQQYIPLVVMAILMWTRIGLCVAVAGLIYFLVTKYWIGAGILVPYLLVTILSLHLGKRNVRRLLLSGKPMISPFESMPDLLLIVGFQCLFLAVALFTRGWISILFWCLFGVVVLYQYERYSSRLRPRWSQIHHPLMIRYAACAGQEADQAKRDKRDSDFLAAMRSLLKSVYPHRRDEEVEAILADAAEKVDTFAHRDVVRQAVQRRNPLVPQEAIEDVLDKAEKNLQTDQGRKLYIMLYSVAGVVGEVFGPEERGAYLLALIEGKAK